MTRPVRGLPADQAEGVPPPLPRRPTRGGQRSRTGPGDEGTPGGGWEGLYFRSGLRGSQPAVYRGGLVDSPSTRPLSRLVTRHELRNLHHETDLGVKRPRRATSSVQDLGTTAKLPPAFANPEWRRDMEHVFRSRTADELARLDKRAKVQRKRAELRERLGAAPAEVVTLNRSAEWHEHRAQALALSRAEVVATCGERWRKVQCGCGTRDIPVGCDQTALCPTCSKAHWRRWRKRITRAMEAHLTAERRAWDRQGMLPGIYMITFTMPHSGSIVTDRKRMYAAFRSLSKVANARGWWQTYALTWEVTPGTAGDGHVHMHMAVISSWVPYTELREAWQHAMPGAIQPDVQAPRRRSSKAVQSAADYLAKYVTKGVDPAVFTGGKAAELMVAFRGQRRVSTSRHFWRPNRDREVLCPTCGEKHRALGAPQGLASVVPGVKLHPRGWFDVGRRGAREQCVLRVDTG